MRTQIRGTNARQETQKKVSKYQLLLDFQIYESIPQNNALNPVAKPQRICNSFQVPKNRKSVKREKKGLQHQIKSYFGIPKER